ncbi:MAG: YlxR family protein [Acholeplasmatales bacterium]|jgi:predicted RNA-binding protein YlxR (DUF448 family)|nr:YlxR family protein [Acholeplasmatales bacterium]
MKTRKEIERTCVVTRETLRKDMLFRIVRTPEGNVEIDLKGKKNGRGAYLKKDKDVILKAQKNKILDKALNVSVPDNIYEDLLSMIDMN